MAKITYKDGKIEKIQGSDQEISAGLAAKGISITESGSKEIRKEEIEVKMQKNEDGTFEASILTKDEDDEFKEVLQGNRR